MMRALLLAAAVLLAWPQSSGEYVLVKQGSKEYHRPGCDVVRDTTDIVAMTRAQAEARGLKPHPACDPEKLREAKRAAEYVWIAPRAKRYHRSTCRELGKDRTRITLDEAARKKYWPCPVCKPPVRKHAS